MLSLIEGPTLKIKYYADTDTLYIEFRAGDLAETRDLDENTLLDLDAQGNLCAMTIEHASTRAGAPVVSYEKVPACLPAKIGRHGQTTLSRRACE